MNSTRRKKVCFFAPVADRKVLETTEFYAQDLAILGDLGFDVRVATRWAEIPWGCDLYFVWWWSWAFMPLIKARLLGRPVLATGVIDRMIYGRRSWPVRKVFRWNFVAADWNVVLSEYDFRWLHDEFGCTHVSHIPLGVDTERYAPASKPRESFFFTVCWMKRSNAIRKSMFELIGSVPAVRAALPGSRFVIAGSLEEGGSELKGLARRLGVEDAVEFLGRVDAEEKIRLMQSCQIYLQPTRFEGFGMAIAEALSCGAPVVSSRTGSVPEVAGDCAFYVDGTRSESIAQGVIRLSLDPSLRRELSLNGRARIERDYSIKRRRDGLAEVIDRLLSLERQPVEAAQTA